VGYALAILGNELIDQTGSYNLLVVEASGRIIDQNMTYAAPIARREKKHPRQDDY
jgi:hypothetical protein